MAGIFGRRLRRPYLPVSLDDVIWLFENLNHFSYGSIFEQPLLAFFRQMHEKYGIAVSLYCFHHFLGQHRVTAQKGPRHLPNSASGADYA